MKVYTDSLRYRDWKTCSCSNKSYVHDQEHVLCYQVTKHVREHEYVHETSTFSIMKGR